MKCFQNQDLGTVLEQHYFPLSTSKTKNYPDFFGTLWNFFGTSVLALNLSKRQTLSRNNGTFLKPVS
jgi:hypothetical protein